MLALLRAWGPGSSSMRRRVAGDALPPLQQWQHPPATHEPPAAAPHEAAGAPSWLTHAFAPVSLDELNARAAMLKRSDNKYIVRAVVLHEAVPVLAREFDILEIADQRAFIYETCYFDDAARSSYFEHHQGRRRRCKVRMRKYVDAGQCFVEVKLKDKAGVTVKKRLACAPEQFGQLDERALAFVRTAYHDHYGDAFTQQLQPVVVMRYQRLTLVAKAGGERMTVDFGLEFATPHKAIAVAHKLFLLETKSARANGVADKILRALHQHPTSPCSKYCISLAALEEVDQYNRFLPALRRLDIVPPGSHRRPAPRVASAARPSSLVFPRRLPAA